MTEETRAATFKATVFEDWMAEHESELGELFGQNPDIIIRHNYADRTVTVIELPSKNRKQSMIDLITKEIQEESE